MCVTPVTRGIRKQGKDLENASRRAGGARDIASLAPTKTLAMICDGDGSWDANSCTCCRFCNGNGQGQSQEPRKRQVCSQAKGPFLGVETCTCMVVCLCLCVCGVCEMYSGYTQRCRFHDLRSRLDSISRIQTSPTLHPLSPTSRGKNMQEHHRTRAPLHL